jgi:peptidoglycan hydrolase CwlO-like protein
MAKQISERTNKLVNIVISLGAAVVIIGALAKIIHLSWADIALVVGLSTEAAIFVIYAFLPPPPVDNVTETTGGKINATELVAALNNVQQTVQNVSDNLGTINSSTEGLKHLNNQFLSMSKTIEEMNHFYGSLKEMSTSMNATVSEAARTKEQMTHLADNLTQLNQVYSKMIHAMQGK